MKTLFGLPAKVTFCKQCVESNQRFVGSVQHADEVNKKKSTALFDKDGVCMACKYYENKKKINWQDREKELIEILKQYRRSDGYYDVLVPGSGGKDSVFVSHMLKYKYKMNPLTVTWAPHMYTDVGWKNFQSWIASGFDNILHTPNTRVHKILTKLAFKNLLHPFQPFAMGQFCLPPKVAIEKKINLIVYGDSHAEKAFGGNIKTEQKESFSQLYTSNKKKDLFFGGVHKSELKKHDIDEADIYPYLPLEDKFAESHKLNIIKLPYFLNYNPQSNYYFASENANFQVNPYRVDGTYTKYTSLDDKIDNLHFYTWFIKTGRGRTTEDAALEIRNNIITREEGVSLVKKFDGEYPKKYIKDILNYLSMSEEEFTDVIDRFRSPHLWEKINNTWNLKHAVWK